MTLRLSAAVSGQQQAAVYRDPGAVDIGRRLRTEHADDPGDVFRLSQAALESAIKNPLLSFLAYAAFQVGVRQWRYDKTRAYRVAADAFGCVVQGYLPGQADDVVLGGGIFDSPYQLPPNR